MIGLSRSSPHFLLCPPRSPIKSEFIRAKYQMLAFVHKLPCRDDDGVTAKDLSKVRGAPRWRAGPLLFSSAQWHCPWAQGPPGSLVRQEQRAQWRDEMAWSHRL